MLDGERSEMRIADEVRGGSERAQQLAQESGVSVSRVHDDGARLREPAVDNVECSIC